MTLFPISLLWYGWSAEGEVHWMMPEIGTLLFAIGLFMTFVRRLYLLIGALLTSSLISAIDTRHACDFIGIREVS
jgi:hypothetical protein